MAFRPARASLALGTVVVAAGLLSVTAVGLSGMRSPGQLAVTIAALVVLAVALLEPYRLLRARPSR